jgi:hypothetical protein
MPKLDLVSKQLLQRDQKQADASLVKLQWTPSPPWSTLWKGPARGPSQVLGNTSAHISKERQRKTITSLNKVHPSVEIFSPLLLGKVFKIKMKAYLESLQFLAGMSNRLHRAGQNFRRGHSGYLPRGIGGNTQRGRRSYNNRNQQRRFEPQNGSQRGKNAKERRRDSRSKDTLP